MVYGTNQVVCAFQYYLFCLVIFQLPWYKDKSVKTDKKVIHLLKRAKNNNFATRISNVSFNKSMFSYLVNFTVCDILHFGERLPIEIKNTLEIIRWRSLYSLTLCPFFCAWSRWYFNKELIRQWFKVSYSNVYYCY